MTTKASMVLALCILVAGIAVAGTGTKKRGPVEPVNFSEGTVSSSASQIYHMPSPNGPRTVVGSPTGLTGFYDYQVNGGAAQHIRTNPTNNGQLHATYMLADDSANSNTSRRVAYAYSSNNGTTWTTFSSVRVPARRGGFPTLDLLQGANAGSPVLANHNDPGTGLASINYVDSPPGSGAFSELNAPPSMGGTDDPIWPYTAGTSDGGIVFVASRSAAGTVHMTRTTDFATWSPWTLWPGTGSSGGRYPIAANTSGRVGIALNAVGAGVQWLESTDNGATWPSTSVVLHEAARIAGVDTFQAWVGNDVVYSGNNALHAISELNIGVNEPTDGAQIVFWSQATGYKVVATKSNSPGCITGDLNRAQVNHFSLGYPSIGISGTRIIIVYMGFRPDTSEQGWNYGDIYYVQSGNNGSTWSTPVNLTQSPKIDDRYPSVSRWNPAGFAHIVWQEDPVPGAHAFNDAAPISRSRQMFLRLALTDVKVNDELPAGFTIEQNYPNPFNPSTTIRYSVPVGTDVALNVYNTLGQKVATLVEGYREAGNYEQSFDASVLSSGVYYYTLKAGSFAETRKMILTK